MIWKTAATILVFLVAYVGFLISGIPSGWVISRVNRQLAPAGAHIVDTSGNAWSGHGTLRVNATRVGQIKWDTSPWPLVIGHLQALLHLEGNGITAHARLNASSAGVEVDDLQGRADLALLARIANMPNSAKGTLVADVKSVRLSPQARLQSAKGNIDVHGASLPDFDVNLGTLFLRLSNGSGKNTVHAVLNNTGGDLNVTGQMTLYDGSRYTLIAYLKPHPGQKNDSLRDALSAFIGSPDSKGRYHYVTSGRLGR